jgi:hypothetical protein
MRKIIASLAFLLGTLSAVGQAPPPIPPLPDADRYQSNVITTATASFPVGFAVYGDCGDLTVRVAGVPKAMTTDYTCASASGRSLSAIPLPITDMVVTFVVPPANTTVEIFGNWRARRTSQPTAPGIARQEFNQVTTTLAAGLRDLRRRFDDYQPVASLYGYQPLSPLNNLSDLTDPLAAQKNLRQPVSPPYPDTLQGYYNLTATAGNTCITLSGANFQTTDVGKLIRIMEAGPAASEGVLLSTIVSRSSTSQICLADAPSLTIDSAPATTVRVMYGSDQSTAIQTALDYARTYGLKPVVRAGTYMIKTPLVTRPPNASILYSNGFNQPAALMACDHGASIIAASDMKFSGAVGTVSNGAGGAGTTLNITSAPTTGKITIGAVIAGSGVTTGTTVVDYLTGTGGTGTYLVNYSQNATSTTITGTAPMVTYGTVNPNYEGYLRETFIEGCLLDGSFAVEVAGAAPFYTTLDRVFQMTKNTLRAGFQWGSLYAPVSSGGAQDRFVRHDRDAIYKDVTGITNAANPVVTTRQDHGYTVGRVVLLYSPGQPVYNGQPVTIDTTPTARTFTLRNFDTRNAVATGSISGTTLTIAGVPPQGNFRIGMTVTGTGVTANTVITGYGTGNGSTGTYTVNNSQTVASTSITAAVGSFTTSGWASLNMPSMDVPVPVYSISSANPAVVTSNTHGLLTGDKVLLRLNGQTSLVGIYTITKVSDATFSLDGVNNTGGAIGAYSGGGYATKWRDPTVADTCILHQNNADSDSVGVQAHGCRFGVAFVNGGYDGKQGQTHCSNPGENGTFLACIYAGGDMNIDNIQCDLPIEMCVLLAGANNTLYGMRVNYAGLTTRFPFQSTGVYLLPGASALAFGGGLKAEAAAQMASVVDGNVSGFESIGIKQVQVNQGVSNKVGALTWSATSVSPQGLFLPKSTVPSVSSCGTSPAIDNRSTMHMGSVTFGTGTPSQCTVLWATNNPSQSFCTISAYNTAARGVSALVETYPNGIIIKTSAGIDGAIFNYICMGS